VGVGEVYPVAVSIALTGSLSNGVNDPLERLELYMPEPDIKIDARALDDGAEFSVREGGWWDRREAVVCLCFFALACYCSRE